MDDPRYAVVRNEELRMIRRSLEKIEASIGVIAQAAQRYTDVTIGPRKIHGVLSEIEKEPL